jgi:SSS family transporter
MEHALSLLDYAVLIGYFLAVLTIGWYCSRRQTSTAEYFLAGKSMKWLPLGISIYASLFSSITYMALPAESFQHDLQYAMGYLAVPVAMVFAVVLFVDFYRRLYITTVFEWVEKRFNGVLRAVIAVLYCVFRSFYAGVVLYTLSLALSVTTGVPIGVVLLCVGLVAVLYTLMGGIRAVIWTDVMQFCVLFGGVLLTLLFITHKVDGGFATLLEVGSEHHKFRTVSPAPFSFTERLIVWGVMLHIFISQFGSWGTDQITVQRFLSGKSSGQSKWAMVLGSLVGIPVQALLYLVGIALFVYYLQSPDPHVAELIAQGEQKSIFPYFIVSAVPVGIRGLLLGGLLAAAMSTIDSVLNTLSAVTVTDFYRRWFRRDAGDRDTLRLARWFIVFWGVAITAASYSMTETGSILETTVTVLSVFMGQLLGVFLLGIFVKRATSWGVLIGAVCGQMTVLLMKFGWVYIADGALRFSFGSGVGEGLPGESISFIWYGGAGLVLTLAVGYMASLFFKPHDPDEIEAVMWKWRGWRSAFRSDGAG